MAKNTLHNFIYIYIYIHTHTHTYTYVHIHIIHNVCMYLCINCMWLHAICLFTGYRHVICSNIFIPAKLHYRTQKQNHAVSKIFKTHAAFLESTESHSWVCRRCVEPSRMVAVGTTKSASALLAASAIVSVRKSKTMMGLRSDWNHVAMAVNLGRNIPSWEGRH